MNLQIIDLFRENELLQIELMGNKAITTDDSDKENKTPKRKLKFSPSAPTKKRKLGSSMFLNACQTKLKF